MTTSAVTSQWLTLAQAAQTLGVCTRTIRRRISTGDLPAYKIGRKAIRIKVADLDRISRRIPSARS
ncbi:MAG: helix-turn-helix domain-containing protein [Propionibacteriaceae bacterium]|nr:helix-turn-helix domain-containing protein [Propionibacteriaceae bacterium]